MAQRIIFHADLDAFFAACEELERPEIKGKPVVVGADPKEGRGRGVVSTCNYAARKFGIHSAMPISQAYRLCPDAVFLPVNFELYEKFSSQVMEILRSHAGKFEIWGIDEAFLDVGDRVTDFEEATVMAGKIKEEVKGKLGLTCSIGIGPNKLLAKTASDFQKPDGLTVVRPEEASKFLAPLPVRKLLWVGPKTEEKLKKFGIEKIGQLAESDATMLFEEFGKMGPQLKLLAQGIDDSPVMEEEGERKSISARSTFEEDVDDEQVIFVKLDKLIDDVEQRLQAEKSLCKTVTVHVRYANFEEHTRSATLEQPTDEKEQLGKVARELMGYFLQGKRKVRQAGFAVSNLVKEEGQTKIREFFS